MKGIPESSHSWVLMITFSFSFYKSLLCIEWHNSLNLIQVIITYNWTRKILFNKSTTILQTRFYNYTRERKKKKAFNEKYSKSCRFNFHFLCGCPTSPMAFPKVFQTSLATSQPQQNVVNKRYGQCNQHPKYNPTIQIKFKLVEKKKK